MSFLAGNVHSPRMKRKIQDDTGNEVENEDIKKGKRIRYQNEGVFDDEYLIDNVVRRI